MRTPRGLFVSQLFYPPCRQQTGKGGKKKKKGAGFDSRALVGHFFLASGLVLLTEVCDILGSFVDAGSCSLWLAFINSKHEVRFV